MSHGHLSFDKLVGFFPETGIHHTVLDGKAVGGELIQDGNIQIPVDDHSQRPGNRGGAHNNSMRSRALLTQSFPLAHAKPMLLIGDDYSQGGIFYFFLDQGMGSDNDAGGLVLDTFICLAFFLRRHGSCQKLRLIGQLLAL